MKAAQAYDLAVAAQRAHSSLGPVIAELRRYARLGFLCATIEVAKPQSQKIVDKLMALGYDVDVMQDYKYAVDLLVRWNVQTPPRKSRIVGGIF